MVVGLLHHKHQIHDQYFGRNVRVDRKCAFSQAGLGEPLTWGQRHCGGIVSEALQGS